MNLQLLFKIAAGYMALWVLAMWFAPEAAMSSYGWDLTPELKSMMQGLGYAFAGIIAFHVGAAQWAGDNLQKFGMVAAVLWFVGALMQLNDLRIGMAPANAGTIVPIVIQVGIAGLFYFYSKK